MAVQGCHNCKKRKSAQTCAACRRVDFDDINISKEPHIDDADIFAGTMQDAAPSSVSRLPLLAERRLLQLFAEVTALDPLDALLLLHVAKGGSLAAFGKVLNRIAEYARSYGGEMSRATAYARFEVLSRKFKPFAALAHWRSVGNLKNRKKKVCKK